MPNTSKLLFKSHIGGSIGFEGAEAVRVERNWDQNVM
jgi:hypothetical protein